MTVIPSGLGSFLGFKKEETFGTYVAPSLYLPFDSSSIVRQQQRTPQSGILRAGLLTQLASLDQLTVRSASGDLALPVPNKGFGTLLQFLHGNTVTPEQVGVTTAYKQVHNIGLTAPTGKSFSTHICVPQTDGTGKAFTYPGCKITQLALAMAVGGDLQATVSINAQDETTGEVLATPSYAEALEPFVFNKAEVKIASDTLGVVTDASLTIPLGMKVDRFGLSKSALASEPIPNAINTIEGSVTMEFASLTQYEHFTGGGDTKVIFVFEGATISGENTYKLELEMPACHFTGSSPVPSGPDVISAAYPFMALSKNGGNPLIATYVSTDSSL